MTMEKKKRKIKTIRRAVLSAIWVYMGVRREKSDPRREKREPEVREKGPHLGSLFSRLGLTFLSSRVQFSSFQRCVDGSIEMGGL